MLDTLLKQAWQFIHEKRIKQARDACNELNLRYPGSSDGWFATSFLATQINDIASAIIAIKKSIDLEPEQAKWQIHFANTLLLNKEKSQSLSIALELTCTDYKNTKLCSELALLLCKLNQFELSQKYYKQAIKLSPNNSQLLFNLASVQRFLGELDLAEGSYDKALKLNPQDFEAYLLRSGLRKQSVQSNHVPELQKLIHNGIKSPMGKIQVLYALAKEQEDLEDYRASFLALADAADSRRDNMRYEVQGDVATLGHIIDTFDKDLFSQEISGHNNDEAIFILGLPRTGSTLIERIVGNHDQVTSAGELNNFAMVMMEECKKISTKPPQSKRALVELTRKISFNSLGKNYIASTRPATGHTTRFIDKLPLNSLYVGLIHLALPKAKIIHVKRHPLDTCYAIYKQLFTDGYPFSYNLDDLAEYYIAHHKLMNHWDEVLPGVIHHVAYEYVISNIDQEAKDLIKYCDLDWQPRCVDFHTNQAASTTASASQVREPLYRKSLARWRNYEQQLAPLKLKLEQAGIICD